MVAVSHKAKHYLLATAKVLVLATTFGYIYFKLIHSPAIDFAVFKTAIGTRSDISGYLIILFLCMAAANWFFEILKWKTLVSYFEKINFKIAMKQCLASLMVSLATPNRIGEYGAKALFFEREKRKKVLLLNFCSGAIQMLVTTVFGVFGLFYFLHTFHVEYSAKMLSVLGIGFVLFLGLMYLFRAKELFVKGFSISKIRRFIKTISFGIKLKTLLFSIARYFIFSTFFYFILIFFGANIGIIEAFPLIFAMYLLVSILPTFFIFDVVIRGGVAVWVFSFAGIAELTVLCSVLAMWLFNFVLPALLGSFYVFTYQPIAR